MMNQPSTTAMHTKTWQERFQLYYQSIWRMGQLAWQAGASLLIAVFGLQFVTGLLPTGMAWTVKQIIDRLLTLTAFEQSLVLLLFAWVGLQFLTHLSVALDAFLASELQRRLKVTTDAIFHNTLGQFQGLAYFESPRFHNLLTWATHGLQMAPSQLLSLSASSFRSLITFFSFIIALIYVEPLLALLVVLASLPRLYLKLKISQKQFQVLIENTPDKRKATYLNSLLTNVRHIKEVRLWGLSDYLIKRYITLIQRIQSNEREQALQELLINSLLVCISVATAGLSFFLVISSVLSGAITVGDVTLYISAVIGVQSALTTIFHAISRLNRNSLIIAQFEELTSLEPDLHVASESATIGSLSEGISIKNVWFKYSPEHPWVLKGTSLFIPKGKCVALVGKNGTGKTTLVKLLTRLYDPTDGAITWDDINIKNFDVDQYRTMIATIFQDFVRYELSIRENIGFGQLDQLDNLKAIQNAAHKSGIHEDIEKLPAGYATSLSRWLASDETGVNFSGGQWQKIALARLAMRDAELLILDEPTAALDAKAEYEIYQRFIEMTTDQTSLLISHRFSTVKAADYIAVIDDGQIVEYGTHDELIALDGLYKDMYNSQANRYHELAKN